MKSQLGQQSIGSMKFETDTFVNVSLQEHLAFLNLAQHKVKVKGVEASTVDLY